MKKPITVLLVLGALVGGYYFFQRNIPRNPPTTNIISHPIEDTTSENANIKIANWNLQIFGDSKASKPELMDFYVDTLTNYDIVFVQEIRDEDGSSFKSLCSKLTNYDCQVSSRAGRSSSKEQYGILYKKGIKAKMKDYNPDEQDRWERPPVAVTFDINGYSFTAYNIHTKPEDVATEMNNLESIVSDSGNVVILGDLNADCSYYANAGQDFASWTWLIKDNRDTTLAQTRCAYDRIIVNSDMNNEVTSSGIYTKGITSKHSDHYLVWVEVNARD